MELAVSVLASSAVSAVLAAAMIFLAKQVITERVRSAIKHEYDEKLESHKAQLQSQNAVEVERLRSELAITAHERQIVFSALHERVAKTIIGTYRRLRVLLEAMEQYIKLGGSSADPPQSVRRDIANKARGPSRLFSAPQDLPPGRNCGEGHAPRRQADSRCRVRLCGQR